MHEVCRLLELTMSGKEESGAGEMIDIVLYMFVLGPAVEWCLKSPRVNKGRATSRRGIFLAVGLLTAIAAVKLSVELVGREVNHFQTLGLRVDATQTEVKKAYKRFSLKYHPDKLPDDPDAPAKFMKYQVRFLDHPEACARRKLLANPGSLCSTRPRHATPPHQLAHRLSRRCRAWGAALPNTAVGV